MKREHHVMNDLANFSTEYDPCDGYTCHEYAKCYKRGGRAVCQCNDGYVGSGKYCKGLFDSRIIFFYSFRK